MGNWLAARTRSRHEKFVQHQLESHGITSYVPTVREKHHWGPRIGIVESVLITGYCFVQPEEPRDVLRMVGVVGFVTCMSRPATIPDEEIEILRMACDSKYRARESYGFHLRDAVRIVGTPFDGLVGTVDSIQSTRIRVILPMSFGKSISVEFEQQNVEPLPTRGIVAPTMVQVPAGVH